MKKVLVILGPTATGKTDLALSLAKKYNGELVACDSRQVYKGLDIGAGKELSSKNKELKILRKDGNWQIDGIKVWMYDVVDPAIQFTVKDYVNKANKVVEDIIKRGKLPIIVGGTGLYLKALLVGLPSLVVPVDEKLREELVKLSLEELQSKLISLSPIKWEKMNNSDQKNPRRLLRSIELICMNPYIHTQHLRLKTKNWDVLKIGLTAPRQVLSDKISLRLVRRVNQGLIAEGEKLHQKGLSLERMRELGLEYGALAELLARNLNKEQFIERLGIKIRQYAKRQLTWFKKEQDVLWFDISTPNVADQVEKRVSFWYHAGDDKTS